MYNTPSLIEIIGAVRFYYKWVIKNYLKSSYWNTIKLLKLFGWTGVLFTVPNSLLMFGL